MHADLDEKPYIEYLDGRAIRKVSPKRRHALLQLAIARRLQDCAGREGVVGTEWRFHLDAERKTTLVPDVAFVSRRRLAALPVPDREEPPFAPDIAVEVRSPSDRLTTIEAKIIAYLRFGAELVLDVLPDDRVIRAATKAGVDFYREGDVVSTPLFPWLRLDVRDIFAAADVD